MSGTETHKGKLVPLSLRGHTLEQRAFEVCSKFGFKREERHESFVALLEDEGYRQVYIIDDVIYEIQNTEVSPNGFAEASVNSDGSIDYFVSYYNGGCDFNEALDAAVNKVDS